MARNIHHAAAVGYDVSTSPTNPFQVHTAARAGRGRDPRAVAQARPVRTRSPTTVRVHNVRSPETRLMTHDSVRDDNRYGRLFNNTRGINDITST